MKQAVAEDVRPRRARALLAAPALLALLACGDAGPAREVQEAPPLPGVPAATGPRDVAVIEVPGFGEIRVELLSDVVPEQAARFRGLAMEGAYDGTAVARVVPGRVVELGEAAAGASATGPGGDAPGAPDAAPPVSHVRGVVSMPRLVGDDHAPPLRIALDDQAELDASHTVFGHVVGGLDVADRLALVPRDVEGRGGPPDRPLETVTVSRVVIERNAGGIRALRGEGFEEELGPSEWHDGF